MDVLDVNHLLKTTPFIIFLNGTIFFRQPFSAAVAAVVNCIRPIAPPAPPVLAFPVREKRGTK